VENLKSRLFGKTPWWRVKIAPTLSPENNTITKRFLNTMLKDIYGKFKVNDTQLSYCLRNEYVKRSSSDIEIIDAIYSSMLKTGTWCVINEFNPCRHDVRIRRKINRIIGEIQGLGLVEDSLEKLGRLFYKLFNIIIGNANSSVAYDNRALKKSLNRPLQKSKKYHSAIHKTICDKYCLDPDDESPIKSSVPSVTINCKKTGLFIKTPSRFALYSELEDLVRSSSN